VEINALCKVRLGTVKWIVNSKSLETVTVKILAEFQRYLAEYSLAFYNVREYMF